MVNYLERARALAECSPVPSINVTPAQQRKPEQFPKLTLSTGTKLFLLTYVALSVVTFTFATKSAVFWSVIPFVIASLTIYALCTEKHKYLYPFLIVSSLHIILCIVVVLIIITFTAASYGTFRQIVGYYMKIRLSDTFIVVFVITSVVVFLILSIMHLWQKNFPTILLLVVDDDDDDDDDNDDGDSDDINFS
ncbi:hypothetical protein DINM_020865 [Dirofilaria immitis]|nr:hypothetical protein [Dirofilaria immitis]